MDHVITHKFLNAAGDIVFSKRAGLGPVPDRKSALFFLKIDAQFGSVARENPEYESAQVICHDKGGNHVCSFEYPKAELHP